MLKARIREWFEEHPHALTLAFLVLLMSYEYNLPITNGGSSAYQGP